MIRITSKRDGFWRCGMRHGAEPKLYPDDRFDEEELARLKAEPMLIVETGLPDPKDSAKSRKKEKTGKGKEEK